MREGTKSERVKKRDSKEKERKSESCRNVCLCFKVVAISCNSM